MSKSIADLIREYHNKGDYTGWFEQVYALDNAPPWANHAPHPHLVSWARAQHLMGAGQRALVIGCGLGDDAEFLSGRGFDVTAFDISETAIDICQRRFPDSDVHYVVADLFALPEDWQQAYDFVLESRTIQALPASMSHKTIEAIANLVAPGGTLLVLCDGREPHEAKGHIPWPLSRRELQAFIEQGLTEVQFDEFHEGGERLFRVVYRAPQATSSV